MYKFVMVIGYCIWFPVFVLRNLDIVRQLSQEKNPSATTTTRTYQRNPESISDTKYLT